MPDGVAGGERQPSPHPARDGGPAAEPSGREPQDEGRRGRSRAGEEDRQEDVHRGRSPGRRAVGFTRGSPEEGADPATRLFRSVLAPEDRVRGHDPRARGSGADHFLPASRATVIFTSSPTGPTMLFIP